MKVKIGKKKIKINEIVGFFNRFKCMKFKLEPITEGYRFSKKKSLSTYFFCQRVDVVMTDKDNKIIYMKKNLNTEKRILWKRKVFYTYILPLNSCIELNIGDKLKVLE